MKVNPWDRQAAETPVAYEAFQVYRDLGVKRSTAEVARRCGKNLSLMHRWSAQHSWVERCRAWDTEQDRLWREEQAELRRNAAKRQQRIAANMQAKVVQRLNSIDADKMTVRELIEMFKVGALVENQALGGLEDEAESSVKAAAGVITELVRGIRNQP